MTAKTRLFETIEYHFPPGVFKMYAAVGYKDVNRGRAQVYTDAKQPFVAIGNNTVL